MILPLLLVGCGRPLEVAETPAQPAPRPETTEREIFTDRSVEAGLDFIHFNGMTGEFYFPEINGSGAALFDYDRDGDLDVYLVQGNLLDPTKTADDAIFPPAAALPLTDRVFRNDLDPATGELRFTDVTAASGLAATGYGMGVTTADFDRDGWVDLYVTNLGPNQLLRNNGDGTFDDVTAAATADDRRWSIAAVFFDYDGDGWLDLYCGNYVDFNLGTHKVCRTKLGQHDFCGPLSFRPEPDSLFRNRGDGTFEDVTARARLGQEYGNGMGAVAADLDGNGWIDLYVANDGVANQMWLNQGNGTFTNRALLAGTAVNEDGQAEASMGVDVADFDGDGDPDVLISHLAEETNTIYRNDGLGFFDDASVESGLGTPSWPYTGFGAGWIDYDNDGLLDVFIANGAVRSLEAQLRDGSQYPLAQANQLYRQTAPGRFQEVSDEAGATFALPEVSRGTAFGDIDNDGDTDAVVVNNSGPARLFVNNVGQDNDWVGLRAIDPETGTDLLGSRIGIFLEDGSVLWRQVKTAGSYASASDPRVIVGLGDNHRISKVRVHWPLDHMEEFTDVTIGRYNDLVKGTGVPIS